MQEKTTGHAHPETVFLIQHTLCRSFAPLLCQYIHSYPLPSIMKMGPSINKRAAELERSSNPLSFACLFDQSALYRAHIQPVQHFKYGRSRYGKADALRFRIDGCVNADHFALLIKQRAA